MNDLIQKLDQGNITYEEILCNVKSLTSLPSEDTKASYPSERKESNHMPICNLITRFSPPKQNNTSQNINKFINRTTFYEEQKSQKILKLKSTQESITAKECTFHPAIHEAVKPNEPFEKRLYDSSVLAKREKMREDKQASDVNSEISRCTFKPTINKYKSRPSSSIRSRTSCNNSNSNYTFHPCTNKVNCKSAKLHEYLNKCPYDRLSTNANAHQRTKSNPKNANSSFIHSQFQQRQSDFIRQKKEKLEKIQKEADSEITHSPRINPKSLKLVKSNFSKRLEMSMTQKELRKSALNTNEDDECTFHPTILSAKIKPVSVASNRCVTCPTKETEQSFSFKPSITPFKGAASKLKIQNPDFIKDLIKEEESKQHSSDAARLYKIYQELTECTYKPVINTRTPSNLNTKLFSGSKQNSARYSKI
jgi:hypothetical protein